MKAKHQRLILGVLALGAVAGGGLLAASGLGDAAAYFRTPAQLAAAPPAPGTPLRLGGMVADGSIVRLADGVSIEFVAVEGAARQRVRYTGIVPDLFKEGSGMVADGTLAPDGTFVAERILAKHDENYMPPQMAETSGAVAAGARDAMAATVATTPAPATR